MSLQFKNHMYILYWFRLLSDIHFLSQFIFWPAPTLTLCSQHSACSCNEASIPLTHSHELFLTGQPWYNRTSLFDVFYCIFYPFLNLLACSFWLIVVICERTCVLCEVCVLVQYHKIVTLVYSTTRCTPRSCFEAFYCIFVPFLICNLFYSPSTIFLGSLAARQVWYFAHALHLFFIWNVFLYEI